MKVTISVKGRFHAFCFAKQLQEHGHLKHLITTYHKFETVKYGVHKKYIRSLFVHEIIVRGWRRLSQFVRSMYNPNYIFSKKPE